MKPFNKLKIYLTTGLIAPMFSPCNLQTVAPKTEKPKPQTESLAYLAYKSKITTRTASQEKSEMPVFFGDEWAI